MSRRQAAWAAQHDWFISETMIAPGVFEVLCRDEWVLDGALYTEQVTFTDFHVMHAWAGY